MKSGSHVVHLDSAIRGAACTGSQKNAEIHGSGMQRFYTYKSPNR